MEKLIQLFEPFLARPKSKKPINRFTLDFTALLRHSQPEISQLGIAFRSAEHFAALLKKRGVSETAWRVVVMALVGRELLAPYTPMFLWCKSCPEDGFIASLPFSLCPLPPLCPGCGQRAHAIASYAPATGFDAAARLKDGLLGAAVGWHLTKRHVRFWHSHDEGGTELDFIAEGRNGTSLIECKMLGVMSSNKQLLRNLRDAAGQLDKHAALLEQRGWKLLESVCVVNLSAHHLNELRREAKKSGARLDRLISYEQFTAWFRLHHRT
jgi:hypothetical protein